MQVNKIETAKKLKMLEVQADMLKTSKKKYDITDKEMSNLAPTTRYFHLSLFIVSFFSFFENEVISVANVKLC